MISYFSNVPQLTVVKQNVLKICCFNHNYCWLLLKNHFFALPKVVQQQFTGEVGEFIFFQCIVSSGCHIAIGWFFTELFKIITGDNFLRQCMHNSNTRHINRHIKHQHYYSSLHMGRQDHSVRDTQADNKDFLTTLPYSTLALLTFGWFLFNQPISPETTLRSLIRTFGDNWCKFL